VAAGPLATTGKSAVNTRYHLVGRNSSTPLTFEGSDTLSTYLAQRGANIPLTACDQGERIVCVDVAKQSEIRKLVSRHKTGAILVRNEPAVVCPGNFNTNLTNRFERIIDVGRPSTGNSISVNWPQTFPEASPECNPEERLGRAVVINAYKYSFLRGQLYGLRAAVCSRSELVDLYGPGWSQSQSAKVLLLVKELILTLLARRFPRPTYLNYLLRKPMNYLGTAEDKLSKLAEYRVSLVIENDPSFLSEKLFDSFFAGTIPIYVGDTAAAFGIPENLYVSASKTISDINAAVKNALEMDYSSWRKGLDEWLYSAEVIDKWSAKNVLPRIAGLVLE
jgi:hypothetical protein